MGMVVYLGVDHHIFNKMLRDTAGNRTFRESRFSETPIVWRNTSVTFARDDKDSRERNKDYFCFSARCVTSLFPSLPTTRLHIALILSRYTIHYMSTGQFGYGGVPGWCLDPACGYQVSSSYFFVSQISRQTHIETMQPRPFEEWIEKGHQ